MNPGPDDASRPLAESTVVDHLEHCERLSEEVARFANLLETTTPELAVPSCPGWNVAGLALHLGTVHRWADQLVRSLAPTRVPASEMGLDEGPADAEWLRRGGATLVQTLRSADPAAPMWAWGPDQHVRFWSRRQLHETLVHRFDLELANGNPPSSPPSVAADTIDEFLGNLAAAEYFSPSVALLRGDGESILFRAIDTDRAWTVVLHSDGFDVRAGQHPATATVSGPASVLSLVVYRRLGLTSADLELKGSHELVDFWLANSALG